MASNGAFEFPGTLPTRGSTVVLRLLALVFPPLTAEDMEERLFSIKWNLTAREAESRDLAFTLIGEDPVALAHVAGGLCKQFGWTPAEQRATPEEEGKLKAAGMPIAQSLAILVARQPSPGEEGPDLQEFCAGVWAFMDTQNRKDVAMDFHAAMQTTDPAQVQRLIGSLPEGLRLGPDDHGRFRPACGARKVPVTPKTPGGGLLGEPCLTPGKVCRQTTSGYCWRRWAIDPTANPIDLIANPPVPVAEPVLGDGVVPLSLDAPAEAPVKKPVAKPAAKKAAARKTAAKKTPAAKPA